MLTLHLNGIKSVGPVEVGESFNLFALNVSECRQGIFKRHVLAPDRTIRAVNLAHIAASFRFAPIMQSLGDSDIGKLFRRHARGTIVEPNSFFT